MTWRWRWRWCPTLPFIVLWDEHLLRLTCGRYLRNRPHSLSPHLPTSKHALAHFTYSGIVAGTSYITSMWTCTFAAATLCSASPGMISSCHSWTQCDAMRPSAFEKKQERNSKRQGKSQGQLARRSNALRTCALPDGSRGGAGPLTAPYWCKHGGCGHECVQADRPHGRVSPWTCPWAGHLVKPSMHVAKPSKM